MNGEPGLLNPTPPQGHKVWSDMFGAPSPLKKEALRHPSGGGAEARCERQVFALEAGQ